MASSSEPTDMIGMDISEAAETIAMGTTMLEWQRMEIQRLKQRNSKLVDENKRLKATIRELRYPYEPRVRR